MGGRGSNEWSRPRYGMDLELYRHVWASMPSSGCCVILAGTCHVSRLIFSWHVTAVLQQHTAAISSKKTQMAHPDMSRQIAVIVKPPDRHLPTSPGALAFLFFRRSTSHVFGGRDNRPRRPRFAAGGFCAWRKHSCPFYGTSTFRVPKPQWLALGDTRW